MIPASYLFKDVYRQHWLEADRPIPRKPLPVRRPPSGGLTRTLAAFLQSFRGASRPQPADFRL